MICLNAITFLIPGAAAQFSLFTLEIFEFIFQVVNSDKKLLIRLLFSGMATHACKICRKEFKRVQNIRQHIMWTHKINNEEDLRNNVER